MLPYGIIFKQSKISFQQSVIIWQRKYGLLNVKNYLKILLPVIGIFLILCVAGNLFVFKEDPSYMMILALLNTVLLCPYVYFTAMKTVRKYTETVQDERIQIVLKENEMEITTAYSKEIIFYDEIDYCFEKDFLLTVVFDKDSMPISVSKMLVEKGSYEKFVSLLSQKTSGCFVKKGEK